MEFFSLSKTSIIPFIAMFLRRLNVFTHTRTHPLATLQNSAQVLCLKERKSHRTALRLSHFNYILCCPRLYSHTHTEAVGLIPLCQLADLPVCGTLFGDQTQVSLTPKTEKSLSSEHPPEWRHWRRSNCSPTWTAK